MLKALRRPIAWAPLALTAAMLGALALYFAGVIPPDPTGDEGTLAHLFQIWFALEIALISLFLFRSLAYNASGTLSIVVLQLCGVFAVCFPVWYLHL